MIKSLDCHHSIPFHFFSDCIDKSRHYRTSRAALLSVPTERGGYAVAPEMEHQPHVAGVPSRARAPA